MAFLGSVTPAAWAQVPEYKLKAEFLERFTRFVEWPGDETSEGGPGAFSVCVLPGSPFGPHLEEMAANRKVKGRPIVIEEVKGLVDVARCQILFIPASEKSNLPRILAKTADHPVLTVGDTDGFADKGVILNFYTSDDTVRFEVNEEAAKRSGLRLSSKLMKLARVVHPAEEERR